MLWFSWIPNLIPWPCKQCRTDADMASAALVNNQSESEYDAEAPDGMSPAVAARFAASLAATEAANGDGADIVSPRLAPMTGVRVPPSPNRPAAATTRLPMPRTYSV